MQTVEVVIAVGVLFIVVVNLAATGYVLRADSYEKGQKVAQAILIWLMPIVGAAICAYVLWQDRRAALRSKQTGNNTAITDAAAIYHYRGANHMGGR